MLAKSHANLVEEVVHRIEQLVVLAEVIRRATIFDRAESDAMSIGAQPFAIERLHATNLARECEAGEATPRE